MNRNKLLPVHPGEILLENFFEPLGISQDRVAKELNVPPRQIHAIVRGERSINADIAHRLAHYFGMSERYWLDLQARYDICVENDVYRKRATPHCLAVAK